MNQFEMKDTCFQFVINVSWQGNNVKIKYDLKINLLRLQCCLVLSRDIHNSMKQVISLQKKMKFSIENFFSKCDQIHSLLRIRPLLLKKPLMENFIFCAVHEVFCKNIQRLNTGNYFCKKVSS